MSQCAWCLQKDAAEVDVCGLCAQSGPVPRPVIPQEPDEKDHPQGPPDGTVPWRALVGLAATVALVVGLYTQWPTIVAGGGPSKGPAATSAAQQSASATLPAGVTACTDKIAVKGSLSCEFARNVAAAYAQAAKQGATAVTLTNVNDPVRGKSFSVVCKPAALVTCPLSSADAVFLH